MMLYLLPLRFTRPHACISDFSCCLTMQGESSSQLMQIKDILASTGSWAVKVMVQEKTTARVSEDAALLTQNAYLVDSEGTVVKLVMEDGQVHRFADSLKPFFYYYVSAVEVGCLNGVDEAVNHALCWTVTSTTKIVLCQELPTKSFTTLTFLPFKHLKWHLDTAQYFNVVALVVGIAPKRRIAIDGKMSTVRQLLLIDRSELPVYLILGKDRIPVESDMIEKLKPTVDDPVSLIATRVVVSSVAGFSLSLRPDSCLMVDPSAQAATKLYVWRAWNYEVIRCYARTISVRPYTDQKPKLSKRIAIPICDVKRKAEMVGVSWVWVFANASLRKNIREAFYMACDECDERVDVDMTSFYLCPRCGEKRFIRPRASFKIKISDGSASLIALVEGKNAEALFDFSAYSLLKNEQQLDNHSLHTTVKLPQPTKQLIQLRKTSTGFVVAYVEAIAEYIHARMPEDVCNL